MPLLTDLVQIRRLGEQKREENLRFRAYLKSRVFVERQFRKAALETENQIECRDCGECCRVGEVQITERDAAKLARFLGLPEKQFMEKHTVLDEDGLTILRRTTGADGALGCEFLSGNECTVYEARPANCERFPHVVRGAGSIQSRMWQFVDRATYCPIVFNWMEAIKGLTKFRAGIKGR